MANKYVSMSTGDDTTGTGSIDNPWQHIHKGIDSIAVGDTILVYPGLYDEEEGRSLYGKNIYAIDSNYKNTIVKPKTFLKNDTDGQYVYTMDCGWNTTPSIIKGFTWIFDKDQFGASWNEGTLYYGKGLFYGIMNDYGTERFIIAINNFFYCTPEAKVGEGRVMTEASRGCMEVYKCTFRNWSVAAQTGSHASSRLLTRDCIVEGCTTGLNRGYRGYIDEKYTCFYNNTTNKYGELDATSFVADPKFTTSTGADLDSTSPCIDAGVVVPDYVEDYFGLAPDIGCYELRSSFPVAKIAGIDGANVASVNGIVSSSIAKIGGIG